MEKHFVEFLSPGTFVSETTTKPIADWNIDAAVLMAADVTERYGAKPYGFRFVTRSREESDLDSRVTASSGIYFLGGRIETLDEIKARNDPRDGNLIFNMKANGWGRVIVNDNSWRVTLPFTDIDTLLEPSHAL